MCARPGGAWIGLLGPPPGLERSARIAPVARSTSATRKGAKLAAAQPGVHGRRPNRAIVARQRLQQLRRLLGRAPLAAGVLAGELQTLGRVDRDMGPLSATVRGLLLHGALSIIGLFGHARIVVPRRPCAPWAPVAHGENL